MPAAAEQRRNVRCVKMPSKRDRHRVRLPLRVYVWDADGAPPQGPVDSPAAPRVSGLRWHLCAPGGRLCPGSERPDMRGHGESGQVDHASYSTTSPTTCRRPRRRGMLAEGPRGARALHGRRDQRPVCRDYPEEVHRLVLVEVSGPRKGSTRALAHGALGAWLADGPQGNKPFSSMDEVASRLQRQNPALPAAPGGAAG